MIQFDEKTESVGWLASLESTVNQAMVASSSSHCIALMRLVKFDICFYLLYTGCFFLIRTDFKSFSFPHFSSDFVYGPKIISLYHNTDNDVNYENINLNPKNEKL